MYVSVRHELKLVRRGFHGTMICGTIRTVRMLRFDFDLTDLNFDYALGTVGGR